MSLQLSIPQKSKALEPKITVLGVGGAGGNAVNNMIQAQLAGVDFVVTNTDAQALAQSICEHKIQLGAIETQGLGAGSEPAMGEIAAKETLHEVLDAIEGSNLVFITAGMGGGTGTGAAPVLAKAIREKGILTIGVVTKPFQFEGLHRSRQAEEGIKNLEAAVDTLIVIPNQNLFRIANDKTTFADAFKMADDVLYAGVRGISDLMVMPGMINLDFADVRSLMTVMGKAMMGTGEASGERRAIEATEAAIANPLLDDASISGAKGVLINISGGNDLTLFEVEQAADRIREELDPNANIIFGNAIDSSLEGNIRVSIVATGINAEAKAVSQPKETVARVTTEALVKQPAAKEDKPAVAAPRFEANAQSSVTTTTPSSGSFFSRPSLGNGAAPLVKRESVVAETTRIPTQELVEAEIKTVEEVPAPQPQATVKPAFSLTTLLSSPTQDDVPQTEPEEAKSDLPLFSHKPKVAQAEEQRIPVRMPVAQAAEPVQSRQETSFFGGAVQSERPVYHQDTSPKRGLFARLNELNPFGHSDETDEEQFQPKASLNGDELKVVEEPKPVQRNESQPRLVGVQGGRSAEAKETSYDNDLLEIPAFLRRQAN